MSKSYIINDNGTEPFIVKIDNNKNACGSKYEDQDPKANKMDLTYLKIPQDSRKKLCKYLFSHEICPHRDCVPFVNRLFAAKQKKGDRIWTSDEHEMLHIIRETSLELVERLHRELTKEALIRAIHALFDALDHEMESK
jgi:hypothetical protein